MVKIPDFVQHLPTYQPGITPAELKTKYGLERVAPLASNENTLGASPKAVEAIRDAAKQLQWYPDGACREVRQRLAEHVGVDAQNIAVGNGSEGVMSYVFKGLFDRGDELLTADCTFVAVFIWSAANNITLKKVPLNDDYQFDLDRMLDSITDSTRAIYLANPNNPTGTMISSTDMETFIEQVPERCLVIVDEAYYEFASELSQNYADTLKWKYDNVITLRTFSKAYGMAGMRFGYGLGAEPLIRALNKMKLTFEPSGIAQAAGKAALDDTEFLQRTLDNNHRGLQAWYRVLDDLSLNYVPSYGNFFMIDLETEDEVNRVHDALLKHGVMTRSLRAYGMPHGLRITVGTEADNIQAMDALKGSFTVNPF